VPQIAIVDVGDPTQPTLVNELLFAPNSQPVELRALPDLNLLVVLNFAPVPQVLTFDVSDCRNPQPLGALSLGAAGHEFFLWRDPHLPSRLLMYVATFQDTGTDLVVVDVSDPTTMRILGTWDWHSQGNSTATGRLHSLSLSPDGRRAYLALTEDGFAVADTSEFADNVAVPQLRLMRDEEGQFRPAPGLNVHSAVLLGNPGYALVTQEVYDCPFADLFIADLADESHPQIVSRFTLPENNPDCAAPIRPEPNLTQANEGVFTSHNPLVVGDLAFVTWYGGGLQVLEVSDPARPYRVGLFVPSGAGAASESYIGAYPVQLWSYPILREGFLYVSDIQSGLYILRYTGPLAESINRLPLAEGNVTVLTK
jgi:hypothetical protein